MADTKFYTNIDGSGIIQLKGVRVQTIADASAQTSFETSGNNGDALGSDNVGLQIYRIDLGQTAIWNGTAFDFQSVSIDGDVVFKGLIDASVAIDDASQPQTVEAVAGNQYVVSVAGTFDAGTSGITLNGNQALQVGDKILFTSETEAYAFQTNVDSATDTTEGTIRLATQSEVDTGTEATAAVTSATLESKLADYARSFTSSVDVVADTPLTISHNLGLSNADGYVVNAVMDGSTVSVDVDTVDADSITVSSLVDLTGLVVTVAGK